MPTSLDDKNTWDVALTKVNLSKIELFEAMLEASKSMVEDIKKYGLKKYRLRPALMPSWKQWIHSLTTRLNCLYISERKFWKVTKNQSKSAGLTAKSKPLKVLR